MVAMPSVLLIEGSVTSPTVLLRTSARTVLFGTLHLELVFGTGSAAVLHTVPVLLSQLVR